MKEIRLSRGGAEDGATTFLSLFLLVVVSVFTLSAPLVAGDEVTLKTSIESAKIYSSGEVQVTRVGSVRVPSGEFVVVCSELPPGFDESSLEVSAHGDVAARIFSVNVRKCYEEFMNTERYRELQEKLKKLEEEQREIENRIKSLEGRKELLSTIGSYSSDAAKGEIAMQSVKVEQWKKMLDFFEGEYMSVSSELSRLEKKKEDLSNEIVNVSQELSELIAGGSTCRRVYIDCGSEAPGEITFELKYTVKDALWYPEYRVKYDSESGEVVLTYLARVRQRTGEDWSGVELSLSTARPAMGAEPPELPPIYIPIRRTGRGSKRMMEQSKDQVLEAVALKSGIKKTGDELHVRGGRSEAASYETSQIRMSRFAANFSIPVRVDIQSGSESRLFMVKEAKLDGKFKLYAAPSVSENAFLRGDFRNTTGVPILGGKCAVYVAASDAGEDVTNFVGTEVLRNVAQGEEFSLFFGVDQDVKIDRKRIKREVLSKSGDKKRKVRYSYLLTVQSFKKKEVEIELKDRIPVSVAKDVKVSDVDISPKPDERGGNGIITWNLTLEPGVKYELKIAYTVVSPVFYREWQTE